MSKKQDPADSGVIIFDGNCGLCSSLIGNNKLFLEKLGFSLMPLQDPLAMQISGLDQAALLQSIHIITPDKKIIRGFDSLRLICEKAYWLAPISFIFNLKILRPIFLKLYSFVAARRQLISSICQLK